eukprot:scaffold102103_cov46-Phaeocystis_antarctica.AAC.1
MEAQPRRQMHHERGELCGGAHRAPRTDESRHSSVGLGQGELAPQQPLQPGEGGRVERVERVERWGAG